MPAWADAERPAALQAPGTNWAALYGPRTAPIFPGLSNYGLVGTGYSALQAGA